MPRLVLRVIAGVLGLLMVAICLFMGTIFVGAGINEERLRRQFADLPVTPLHGLSLLAGTGKRVRVEARALGSPVLRTPSGQTFAFQRVELKHTKQTGAGRNRRTKIVIDYDVSAPAAFYITDGGAEVLVRTAAVDPTYLPVRAQGTTGTDGSLPDNVRHLLPSRFGDIPARYRGTLTLWGIGAGERITVFGSVGIENGRPVLQAPPDRTLFVISPMRPEEIDRGAEDNSRSSLALGLSLLVIAAVLIRRVIVPAFRRRARANQLKQEW